ncbi:hypothetical protein BASA83_013581 [Batrachochytrium salamandrivorans]|nr:hypothetical protein BASA83_013581 [Batrachochytrium salamandrivorans]
MDQAIRIDNRIFERRLEQQYNLRSFRRNPTSEYNCSRIQPQQYQQRFDIDFARRGPLTTAERQQRLSQGLCLFVDSQDTSKPLVPRSNSRFRASATSQAIEMEGHNLKFRETISADSKLENCDRDNSARGMGVRGTEVVLAPRGETGSFTQMPPTSLLYPHQPAKLNLSNSLNLDPTFSDPSILVSALSSLKKLLLPGTLRLGPLSHVDTFFVDCGADDLFMDLKLAADLQIPLP